MFAPKTTQRCAKTMQEIIVDVPTATIIIRHPECRYIFLVGQSKKHPRPVLPGGKIDIKDINGSSIKSAALRCIKREAQEEIGTSLSAVKLFKIHSNSERDVRRVPVESLRGSVVESIIEDRPRPTIVTARYGMPDYLFIGEVDPKSIKATEELHSLTWIDLRKTMTLDLSAGHNELIKQYVDEVILGRTAPVHSRTRRS